MGVFANAADAGGVSGNVSQNSGVGVAAVESEYQGAVFAAGVPVKGLAQLCHLLSGAQAEAGVARIETVLRDSFDRGIVFRLLRRGGVQEGNRGQAVDAVFAGHGGGDLEKALGAYEVGLKAGTEGIAAPGHARGVKAGAAEEGIIKDGAKGSSCGELIGNAAADDGKDVGQRKAIL
jgi:hypothetical protein